MRTCLPQELRRGFLCTARTTLQLALLPLLLLATDVAAATRTALRFGDVPAQVRYSQAINLELTLDDSAGVPLPGTGCDPNPDDGTDLVCAVVVTMAPDENPADVIEITAPDVVVDGEGRARVRITIVDGRHGDATFSASPAGTPYTIAARFLGNGPRATDADCLDGAVGNDNGLRCPTIATAAVALITEVPGLVFNQDVVLSLGDSVTLTATLRDDTGDAEIAGSDVDGSAPRALVGLPIRFFYDKDNNGRPSLSERIGEGTTNADGLASTVFNALPPDVTAGIFAAGLHAEFPGDGRYALARTSVALTVNTSGEPDLAKTIVEVTPEVVGDPAVGSDAVVRVRLVDTNNNILGAEADEHDVVIVTDSGRLLDTVERDLFDGSYKQTIRANPIRGVANITVTVDGEDAGGTTLTINGPDGCSCNGLSSALPALIVLGALGVRRRRRAA